MIQAPSRKKSPRSPSISLEEALDRVEKIYDRERLHPAPTDVIAQHLGYKGANNGAALQALASVRYFGLVDRPKDGYLAVSKDFERYKYAPDDQQRRTLLMDFLRNPPLYADLLDRYGKALPSDASLRFELIERGFSPGAAESALSSFRKSVEYAGLDEEGADHSAVSTSLSETSQIVEQDQPHMHTKAVHEFALGSGRTSAALVSQSVAAPMNTLAVGMQNSEDVDAIPVRLSGGRRAWLHIPFPFFDADKIRLKAQIDLLLTQDEEQDREQARATHT